MSVAELLEQAQANGVLLVLVEGRLTWEADHQPPADLLAELITHKVEIIEALSAVNDPPAEFRDQNARARAEAQESCEPQVADGGISLAWIAARNAYHAHALGGCPHCYPPRQRHCIAGAELRARYDHETHILEAYDGKSRA